MFDWRSDLKNTLTLHQLKNHGLHMAVAFGIAGFFIVFTRLDWFGLCAVGIAGLLKEFVEDRRKVWRAHPHKFFDSIFDVIGWILGGIVPYVVRAALQ